MKQGRTTCCTSAHSWTMTRPAVILFALLLPFLGWTQGGEEQLRAKADALFQG